MLFASQSLTAESVDVQRRCCLLMHPVEEFLNLNKAREKKNMKETKVSGFAKFAKLHSMKFDRAQPSSELE